MCIRLAEHCRQRASLTSSQREQATHATLEQARQTRQIVVRRGSRNVQYQLLGKRGGQRRIMEGLAERRQCFRRRGGAARGLQAQLDECCMHIGDGRAAQRCKPSSSSSTSRPRTSIGGMEAFGAGTTDALAAAALAAEGAGAAFELAAALADMYAAWLCCSKSAAARFASWLRLRAGPPLQPLLLSMRKRPRLTATRKEPRWCRETLASRAIGHASDAAAPVTPRRWS